MAPQWCVMSSCPDNLFNSWLADTIAFLKLSVACRIWCRCVYRPIEEYILCSPSARLVLELQYSLHDLYWIPNVCDDTNFLKIKGACNGTNKSHSVDFESTSCEKNAASTSLGLVLDTKIAIFSMKFEFTLRLGWAGCLTFDSDCNWRQHHL